ncbi:hypothetical protein GCM10027440_33520 [Nocardiopsis coralliicola]
MRNTPPPPGPSWHTGPGGPDGPDGPGAPPAGQPPQAWAWPPGTPTADGAPPVWAWPPPQPPRPAGGPARARPGTPYHRMARTWRFRWWIPPLAVLAVLALIVLTQFVLFLLASILALLNGLQPTPESPLGAELPDTVFLLFVLATMAPIVFLAVRTVQLRPVGSLFSVEGRMRWRWLGVCSLLSVPVIAGYLGLLFLLDLASGSQTPFVGAFVGAERFVPALIAILLLVPFQASAEEFALRGFVLQLVGSYGRDPAAPRGGSPVSRFLRTPVLGILISGTLFAALHDYHSWALLDVAVFGLAMAWLTWYTGGLEAAIGLHVVHNLAAFTLTAWEGALADAATGGGSWQGVVGTAAEVLVYCAAVVLLARRRGLRRTVPGDPGSVPARPERRRLPHWVMSAAGDGPAEASGGRRTGAATAAAGGEASGAADQGSHFQTPPSAPRPAGGAYGHGGFGSAAGWEEGPARS